VVLTLLLAEKEWLADQQALRDGIGAKAISHRALQLLANHMLPMMIASLAMPFRSDPKGGL
jgi:hypothetical protein